MARKMELTQVIKALREDLAKAVLDGAGETIEFGVEGIEVELKTEIERGSEANAGFKFWVADLGVKGKSNDTHGHIVRLKLKPTIDGKDMKFNREVDEGSF